MIGVPVATIRTWEDRYRLVIPDRSASGHRLYRRDQVGQLRFVRTCMAEGASAADAHRLLAEQADGGPRPLRGRVSGVFPEDRGIRGRSSAEPGGSAGVLQRTPALTCGRRASHL